MQLGKAIFERIERGIDRVAAGAQAEKVALDLPARAEAPTCLARRAALLP